MYLLMLGWLLGGENEQEGDFCDLWQGGLGLEDGHLTTGWPVKFSHLEIWNLETLLSGNGLTGGLITWELQNIDIFPSPQRTRESGSGTGEGGR